MSKIKNKIIEYAKANSMRQLQGKLDIGMSLLYAIVKGKKRKFKKNSLDKLYRFFKIPKDKFYYENIGETLNKDNLLGNIFFQKRKKLGFTDYQVAKKIKGSDRHLRRIENGHYDYTYDSYYIIQLMDLYEFTREEKKIINMYLLSLDTLRNLEKKKRNVL